MDEKGIEKMTLDAFTKSNDLGKILIWSIVILVVFVTTFGTLLQLNNNRLIDEFSDQGDSIEGMSKGIVLMVADQAKITDFRKEIYSSYRTADKELDKVVRVLGLILQGNEIPFPQDLNTALNDFRTSFKDINNSLVSLE